MHSFPKFIKAFLIVILFSSVNGCLTEKALGTAYYRPFKSDSLEIELPHSIKGPNIIHNFDFKIKVDTFSHWIYIPKGQNKLNADMIFLNYNRHNRPANKLKGEISLTGSVLTINLRTAPYYSTNVVKHWTTYKFNGTYKLKAGSTN